jgi:hypothetical protein
MMVYEDNFGFLNISEPEERAFFDYVQRQSVLIACERCERPVRLIPPKTLCASCVSALECGAPASMKEYGSQKPLLDPRPFPSRVFDRMARACLSCIRSSLKKTTPPSGRFIGFQTGNRLVRLADTTPQT